MTSLSNILLGLGAKVYLTYFMDDELMKRC
jgi:hypothetical protein